MNKDKNNIDVALATVKEDGSKLKEFSIKVRKDRNVVTAATKNNGIALLYAASDELKQDDELIKLALRRALKKVRENRKNDEENQVEDNKESLAFEKSVKRLFHKYKDKEDLIISVLVDEIENHFSEKSVGVDFVDISLLDKPDFLRKVSDKSMYLYKGMLYKLNSTEENVFKHPVRAVIELIALTYEGVDDFIMGNDLSSPDMRIGRAIITIPVVPIHLVAKGVAVAGKGVKTLGEYAYDKHQDAKNRKKSKEEEKVKKYS